LVEQIPSVGVNSTGKGVTRMTIAGCGQLLPGMATSKGN